MDQFSYTARTSTGEKVAGVIEADSEAAVLRVLEEKNLFPISLGGSKPKTPTKARFGRKVRSRDLGMMYGQLADLIGSGVPLLRAMDSLIRSTVSLPLVVLLKEIRASVADGKSLTESMKQFPETFPPLHTAMVQAGERAAFLEQVLRGLSEFMERIDELRSKVIGAMIYPMLLVFLGTAVMIGALIFFVPKFEPLLGNVKKPLPTEVTFAASKIVRTYWYVVLLGMAGGIAFLWTNLKTEANRIRFERWRFKIPVAGSAMKMLAITPHWL